jgi:hypothetical protein
MAKTTNKYILPDNYLYISHLDEDFQFWRLPCTPETVSDTMGSTFTSTTALGRSAPIWTYSNSGPRTVRVELRLHRDLMDDVNVGVSNSMLKKGEDYIDNLVKALQACVVPKYNLQNKAVEPPLVALRLSNEVFIKGIINGSIGITYSLPILSNGKYAQIALSIEITEVDPYDASTVFANGSFRGLVKTLKRGMNLEDE